MIDLTPLDVRKKKSDFRKGLRGYETDEVDGFLDLVAERLESLVRENAVLREKTSQLSESLDSFRSRESALNEALVSAQQLREEIRTQSEREADLTLREAQAEGQRQVNEAKKDVERQREMLDRLRRQRNRFLRSYRSFLETQLQDLAREEERLVRARTGELDDPLEGEGID